MPPGWPASASRATSIDLAVFMCGRSGTPCAATAAGHPRQVALQDQPVEHQAGRRQVGQAQPVPLMTARPGFRRSAASPSARCRSAPAPSSAPARSRRRRAACRRRPPPGRRSARHRCRSAASSSIARARSPPRDSSTPPPPLSRSAPTTSGSRIGAAIAVPSAMVGCTGGGVRRPSAAAAIGPQCAGCAAQSRGMRLDHRRPRSSSEKPISQPSTFDPAPHGMMTLSGAAKPRSSQSS